MTARRARLANTVMPPTAAALRRYITMQIRAVRDNPKGVVVEVGPVGHMSSRRILIEGITKVSEIPDPPPARDDLDDQHDDEIADEYHERQRYEEDE